MRDMKAGAIEFLTVAKEESSRIGHTYVGTEHLLLAACKLADVDLKAILDRHGVSADKVETEIHRVLGKPIVREPESDRSD